MIAKFNPGYRYISRTGLHEPLSPSWGDVLNYMLGVFQVLLVLNVLIHGGDTGFDIVFLFVSCACTIHLVGDGDRFKSTSSNMSCFIVLSASKWFVECIIFAVGLFVFPMIVVS